MGQAVYGGRVDNAFDQRLLDCLLAQFFTPKCFDFEYPLISKADPNDTSCNFLSVPEGNTKADYERWVDKLPDNESPKWLGLPEKAELLLLLRQGHRSFQKLLRLQDFGLQEEETKKGDSSEKKEETEDVEGVPQWILALKGNLNTWVEMLPGAKTLLELVKKMRVDAKGGAPDPLKRCFEREISLCAKLVQKIHRDFDSMFQIVRGELKLTNYLRSLMLDLSKGLIPKHWMSYVVPESTSFGVWLVDLQQRVKQLQRIGGSSDLGKEPIWLGGLFNPEAFITATRQAAARAHSWSLENLELGIAVLNDDDVKELPGKENLYQISPSAAEAAAPAENVLVTGLTLEGALWDKKEESLALSDKLSCILPALVLKWRNREDGEGKGKEKEGEQVLDTIPIYLNETRLQNVFSVKMKLPANIPKAVFYQRATALTIWHPPF
jgi:dynein heavy chain 1